MKTNNVLALFDKSQQSCYCSNHAYLLKHEMDLYKTNSTNKMHNKICEFLHCVVPDNAEAGLETLKLPEKRCPLPFRSAPERQQVFPAIVKNQCFKTKLASFKQQIITTFSILRKCGLITCGE